MHQKRRFRTRFRKTVLTNAVLSQIDAKRILHQKRRFGTRFRETEITNTVLQRNDAKRTFHKKRRFGTRFREAMITNPVLSQINIRSEFSIKIRARPLVKIDHVIFIYVTVLAIIHENRTLLKMASRFAQVGEEEISQIINDSIPTNTKRQTAWSVSIFKGKSEIKQLKFRNFECAFL